MSGKVVIGFIASLLLLDGFGYQTDGAADYGYCEKWEREMGLKCGVKPAKCSKCKWFGAMPFCANNYCPIGWKTCGWAYCGDASPWCCWSKNKILCCP